MNGGMVEAAGRQEGEMGKAQAGERGESLSRQTVMCLAALSGWPVGLEYRVEGPFIPEPGGVQEKHARREDCANYLSALHLTDVSFTHPPTPLSFFPRPLVPFTPSAMIRKQRKGGRRGGAEGCAAVVPAHLSVLR